ncbi:MAG: hypothetical protein ABJH05_08860 [Fulvivirga sp.]
MASPNKKYDLDVVEMISLTLFFLSLISSLLFFVFDFTQVLTLQVFLHSFLYLIPYVLNKTGYENLSSAILSYLIVVSLLALSIINKIQSLNLGQIEPINYFDVRLVILATMSVPLAIISLEKRLLLFICLIPSFLAIVFFDGIHNLFGVGFYQVGLTSNIYSVTMNLFSIMCYIFLASAFIFLKTKLQRSEQRHKDERKLLSVYLENLMIFGKSRSVYLGNIQSAYKQATSILLNLCDATCVTIWHINKNGHALEPVSCSNNVLPPPLIKKQAPEYFNKLKKQKLVICDQSTENSFFNEFEALFSASDTQSLMSLTFVLNGTSKGVITIEGDSSKIWRLEESILINAIGNILTSTHSAHSIIDKNRLLQIKNDEINAINNGLEATVKKRTIELSEKNKQLSEYAFINSHILRAPVARVHGLYNLIEQMHNNDINHELMLHFKLSIVELNDITVQIRKAIESYGDIKREYLLN